MGAKTRIKEKLEKGKKMQKKREKTKPFGNQGI